MKIETGYWIITQTGDFDDCHESFESRDEAVECGAEAFDGGFFTGRLVINDLEYIDR